MLHPLGGKQSPPENTENYPSQLWILNYNWNITISFCLFHPLTLGFLVSGKPCPRWSLNSLALGLHSILFCPCGSAVPQIFILCPPIPTQLLRLHSVLPKSCISFWSNGLLRYVWWREDYKAQWLWWMGRDPTQASLSPFMTMTSSLWSLCLVLGSRKEAKIEPKRIFPS